MSVQTGRTEQPPLLYICGMKRLARGVKTLAGRERPNRTGLPERLLSARRDGPDDGQHRRLFSTADDRSEPYRPAGQCTARNRRGDVRLSQSLALL